MNGKCLVRIITFVLIGSCILTNPLVGYGNAETSQVKPFIKAPVLPCAEIKKRFVTDAVTVIYASPSIYRRGSILPTKEGLSCLENLADWLKTLPPISWQVVVGGEPGTPFDSQKIADKRLEMLQRYFVRKGIDISPWIWERVTWKVNGRELQLQLKSSL